MLQGFSFRFDVCLDIDLRGFDIGVPENVKSSLGAIRAWRTFLLGEKGEWKKTNTLTFQAYGKIETGGARVDGIIVRVRYTKRTGAGSSTETKLRTNTKRQPVVLEIRNDTILSLIPVDDKDNEILSAKEFSGVLAVYEITREKAAEPAKPGDRKNWVYVLELEGEGKAKIEITFMHPVPAEEHRIDLTGTTAKWKKEQ